MKLPLKVMLVCGLFALLSPTTLAQSGPAYKQGSSYCATKEFLGTTETLPDGTKIVHVVAKERWCRDSLGRSRVEFFLNGRAVSLDSPSIQISDPVEGVEYSLDSDHRAARRTVIAPLPRPPLPPPCVPPPRTANFASGTPPSPQCQIEPLGSQVIESLVVEGNQFTMPHPIGTIENDPLVQVEERWFSRELGEVILMKRSDSFRSGLTVVWQLTDIDRSEPDPALFRVPPGYTIEAR